MKFLFADNGLSLCRQNGCVCYVGFAIMLCRHADYKSTE